MPGGRRAATFTARAPWRDRRELPTRLAPSPPSAGRPLSYQPLPPLVSEYAVGSPRSNVYGTIAMARLPGVTNSASSEWFFNLGNNSFLDGVDGGFTVFGRVVRGFDV